MIGFKDCTVLSKSRLCLEAEQTITKMCKLLLKYETGEEPVKEFMVQWVRIVGHEISMEQWESL